MTVSKEICLFENKSDSFQPKKGRKGMQFWFLDFLFFDILFFSLIHNCKQHYLETPYTAKRKGVKGVGIEEG